MKIKHYGRFMEVSDSLREYTEKKLAKLDWFFDPDAEGQVKYTQEKGSKNIVEITISHKGLLFRSEEATSDMYASVDKAVDKLSRQSRRHRTKLDKRVHVSMPEPAPEAEVDEAPEEERKVVRVKRFSMKPMSVEDAMMQMELLGHNFYLFDNAETGHVCVLYVRQDGDYGLLETEN